MLLRAFAAMPCCCVSSVPMPPTTIPAPEAISAIPKGLPGSNTSVMIPAASSVAPMAISATPFDMGKRRNESDVPSAKGAMKGKANESSPSGCQDLFAVQGNEPERDIVTAFHEYDVAALGHARRHFRQIA